MSGDKGDKMVFWTMMAGIAVIAYLTFIGAV
jgi:hypothetical protein